MFQMRILTEGTMLDAKLRTFITENFPRGHIVAFTGAGISHESGIPTFRGAGGLWERYEPELFATPDGLAKVARDTPARMRDFLLELYAVLLKARPNPAHSVLARMEAAGLLDGVVTQNVDDLHQRAGSRCVAEVHGNCFRVRCGTCPRSVLYEPARIAELVALLEGLPAGAECGAGLRGLKEKFLPRCKCGGHFRTDVVLFGEGLPAEAFEKAQALIDGCSVLLIVGSSLTVYPAASFPQRAKERGAVLIEVNCEPSGQSSICDFHAFGKAAEILPEIVSCLDRTRI